MADIGFRSIGLTLVVVAALSLYSVASQRSNVVLIICEDHAWFQFGCMVNSEIETSRLNRLAAQSVLFARSDIRTSDCRLRVTTMITGHYPHDHRPGAVLEGRLLP